MPLELYVPRHDVQETIITVTAELAGVAVVPCGDSGARVAPDTSTPALLTPDGPVSRVSSIMRYIARVHPDAALYGGRSLFAQSLVDQWVEFAVSELSVPCTVARGSTEGIDDGSVDDARMRSRRVISSLLDILESQMRSRTYVVGERPTIADIVLFFTLFDVMARVLSAEARLAVPSVTRWFATVAALPPVSHAVGPVPLPAPEAEPPARRAAAKPPVWKAEPVPARGGGGGGGVAASLVAGDSEVLASRVGKVTPFRSLFRRRRSVISELLLEGKAAVGRIVTVSGWVKTTRSQSGLCFIALNDGSCQANLQVVCEAAATEGFEAVSKDALTGTSVTAVGVIVESPAKGQDIEVKASSAHVVGTVDRDSYPLGKATYPLEHLRTVQHLRPRTNVIGAVARVRNALAFATHRFFQERGFLYIHTPIITCSDCEGAGELFGVTTLLPEDPKGDLARVEDGPDRGAIDYGKDFFGRRASLTVSGQLQVEAYSCSMSDVYTFGPTFRAENSNTTRHLAEFWMIEPEISFADLNDDMNLAEDYVKFCTQYALDNCSDDIAFFDKRVEPGLRERLEHVVASEFVRVTYTEAVELLLNPPKGVAKPQFVEVPSWGCDLASEHERFLTEEVFKRPTIVRDYPKEIKAFYMKLNPDRRTVRAMDLLVPKIGELVGGSQREDVLELLEARIAESMDPSRRAALDWYCDLRRFGTCPHAGFGVGFERLVMYVTGVQNIRDVIPFPRFPGHAAV